MAKTLMILFRKYRQYINVNAEPIIIMVIGLTSAAAFEDLEEWANHIGGWLIELAFLPLELDAAKNLKMWVEQLFILEPRLYTTGGPYRST